MPKLPDEPLHKTNINLYASDVEDMKRVYGYGWSEVVRKLVRQHLERHLAPILESNEDPS